MPLDPKFRVKAYTTGMTLDRAAMMRLLHAEGATVHHLAWAFGCCYTLANDICRGKKWTGTPCQGCWRVIPPANGGHNGWCETCKQQRCCHCGGAKSPGRASARCMTCDRENQRGVIARRGECRDCGERLPETRASRLCSECAVADSATQRRFRNNAGKRCKQDGCENALPLVPSWSRAICRECAKKHDALRRRLARRYCGICGKERQDDRMGGLCPECSKLDKRMKRIGTRVEPAEHLKAREAERRRGFRQKSSGKRGGG